MAVSAAPTAARSLVADVVAEPNVTTEARAITVLGRRVHTPPPRRALGGCCWSSVGRRALAPCRMACTEATAGMIWSSWWRRMDATLTFAAGGLAVNTSGIRNRDAGTSPERPR
jgi:hypothetical protein